MVKLMQQLHQKVLRRRFFLIASLGAWLWLATLVLLSTTGVMAHHRWANVVAHDLSQADDGQRFATQLDNDHTILLSTLDATSTSTSVFRHLSLDHAQADVQNWRLALNQSVQRHDADAGTLAQTLESLDAYNDALALLRPTLDNDISWPVDARLLRERYATLQTNGKALWQARQDLLHQRWIDVSVWTRSMTLSLAVATALGLFWWSALAFSWQRDRRLTGQLGTLERLVQQAQNEHGAPPDDELTENQDAIDRLARILQKLGQIFTVVQRNAQTAEITNQAAISAIQELDLARGELEQRVQERTESLASTNRDLHAEIERRVEIEAALSVYAEVIRSTGEAVVISDEHGCVVEVNPAAETILGKPQNLLVSQPVFSSHTDPDWLQQLWHTLLQQHSWSGEIMYHRVDGSAFPCWLNVNRVQRQNGETGFVFVLRDITALKNSEEQLTYLAFHDPLTSLPNRAMFNARLNQAVQNTRHGGGAIAVLYLDLDRFKVVNDSLGHPAGDALLREISSRLSACLRSHDLLARLGGDEFIILLSAPCTRAAAETVALRILKTVMQPVTLGEAKANVGTSIGISFYDGHHLRSMGSTTTSKASDEQIAQHLQKQADLALYEAKAKGRGQHRFFTPDLLERNDRRLSLTTQLEHAIEHGEFELHYQPIVNLKTGFTQSVEALLRWKNAHGEWISPATFIPHAEESGLIKRIDAWVLEKACTDAMHWIHEGRNLAVSVNLSGVSAQQSETVQLVSDVLERTGLPPHYLSLEITETVLMEDSGTARKILDGISALGVSLSFDDFGTGYSSLSYLTQFPIRCIKLDRAFIEQIGKSPTNDVVLRSIVELAQNLNLSIIAEGVEEEFQQRFLVNLGCDLIQGYLLGRAQPLDHLSEWLRTHHTCAPFGPTLVHSAA